MMKRKKIKEQQSSYQQGHREIFGSSSDITEDSG